MTSVNILDPDLQQRVVTLVESAIDTAPLGSVNVLGGHTSVWWSTSLTPDGGGDATACDASVQKSEMPGGGFSYHIGLDPSDEDADEGPSIDTWTDGDAHVVWQPAFGFTDPSAFLDAFESARSSS